MSKNKKKNQSWFPENFSDFLDSIYSHLSFSEEEKKQIKQQIKQKIENFHPTKGSAVYVVDYAQKRVYGKGIEDLLGYSKEEFTYDLIFDFFHPQQKDILLRLIAAILQYGEKHSFQDKSTYMTLIYKIKKKSGEYIAVSRSSNAFWSGKEGELKISYSLLVDLTGLVNSEKVVWKVVGKNIDQEGLKQYVYKQYADFFTPKEKEICMCLKQGLTSQAIAKQTHTSVHTVNTHRRKILAKTNSKNSRELIRFCEEYIPDFQ
jgi:DNA-binding CsgD family transcriptional regulator